MSGEIAGNAQNRQLLTGFRRYSDQVLGRRMSDFVDALIDYLTELSHSPRAPGIGRGSLMDCLMLLRQRRTVLSERWLVELGRFRDDLCPPAEQHDQWWDVIESGGALDLVDLDAFEDFLAQERVVSVGEEQHSPAIEALQIRVAQLAGIDPLRLRLPEHPAQLTRALQRALEEQRIPARTLPRIFECFIREFIRPLDTDYRSLNAWLEEHGVRPGLEQEIRSRGSLLKQATVQQRQSQRRRLIAEARGAAGNDTPVDARPLSDASEDTGAEPAAAEEPRAAALYASVLRALETQAGHAPAPADGQPGSGGLAGESEVAQSLAALQQRDPAELQAALQRAGSLLSWLEEHLDALPELAGTRGVNRESRSRLQLVDRLFGTLDAHFNLHEALRPTVERLQLPLARLALHEPHFFLDPAHPARQLMDRLAALATEANFPNRVLEQRLQAIAGDIAERYDGDRSVFADALTQLEHLGQQQASALNRNIERVVAAREGKARLERARQAVDQLIAQTLPSPQAPAILLEVLAGGWRDLMVLVRVKQGPDSEDWREQAHMLQQLTGWLQERDEGGLDGDALVQQALEAGPFVDLLEQQISAASLGSPEISTHLDTLRGILAGDTPVALTAAPEAAESEDQRVQRQRQRIEHTRHLRRWVRRVEQLELGTWLSYRDHQGRPQRMRLAWISEDGERYLFVNERGQKVAELGRVALARRLSHGVKPPTPEEHLSVVDRSMYSTLEAAQRHLSFERNHDQVTRLINREAFEKQLARALRHAQQHAAEHALLLLDIDSFHLVNDVYDRVLGDEILDQFARLLSQGHGRKLSSARLEGDRFALLLVDHNESQAMAVAEQVRSDIAAASLPVEGEAVSFTVAIGVAAIRDVTADSASLFEQAGAALEAAKCEGGNCVRHWQQDQAVVARQRQEHQRSRRALEEAMNSDRFVLRAQPIVKTAIDGQQLATRHYELLLAVRDSEGRPGSPLPFIQSAERYRLMPLVDRWVVREAFRWISGLMDAQKVVPAVAINLSGSSVTDDSFMDFLFEQISEFGVGTNRLCFEITEVGTINNLTRAADFVRAFRNIGCKFSIDDFGTGLESHNYLRELPVDYVKIDGSFVQGLETNPSDLAMARAINDLAHFLGQETIAECVESQSVMEQLREIGVDYLQGWGIGRPVLLDEVTRDLSRVAT